MSHTHVALKQNRHILRSLGDFLIFYIKNVNKTKTIYLNKKIIRAFVDMHAHIPNMHHATFDHMLCIFYVHFGAFSMVNLGLKCTKQ